MSDITTINVIPTVIPSDADYIRQEIELGDQALIDSLTHFYNAGVKLVENRDRIARESYLLNDDNWRESVKAYNLPANMTQKEWREWRKTQTRQSFSDFIKNEVKVKKSQCYNYMALAEYGKIPDDAKTLEDALKFIANQNTSEMEIEDHKAHLVLEAAKETEAKESELEQKYHNPLTSVPDFTKEFNNAKKRKENKGISDQEWAEAKDEWLKEANQIFTKTMVKSADGKTAYANFLIQKMNAWIVLRLKFITDDIIERQALEIEVLSQPQKDAQAVRDELVPELERERKEKEKAEAKARKAEAEARKAEAEAKIKNSADLLKAMKEDPEIAKNIQSFLSIEFLEAQEKAEKETKAQKKALQEREETVKQKEENVKLMEENLKIYRGSLIFKQTLSDLTFEAIDGLEVEILNWFEKMYDDLDDGFDESVLEKAKTLFLLILPQKIKKIVKE